jgi:hypothetical protein
MDHVAHHVEGGILPGNESAVMPDLRGCLNRHRGWKTPSSAPGADITQRIVDRGSVSRNSFQSVARVLTGLTTPAPLFLFETVKA